MATKRESRASYYRGVKEALVEHMAVTENDLRALLGLSGAEIDKVVASVRERHDKLLREVDLQLAEESKPTA